MPLIHSAYSQRVHHHIAALVTFAAAWAIATAATYIVTGTSIFYWLRIRLLKVFRRMANASAMRIKKLPQDYPGRLRNRMRTVYWIREATTHLPSCPVCVGWWAQLLGVLGVWWLLGHPGYVLLVPAWLMLPAVLSVGWVAGIIVTNQLPMVNHLPDPFNVDPIGDET